MFGGERNDDESHLRFQAVAVTRRHAAATVAAQVKDYVMKSFHGHSQ